MKSFFKVCLLCMLTFPLAMIANVQAAADPITVTDILGRVVTIEKPARHIILSQGRHLQTLALIHPDPVSLIAGWKDDMKRDPVTYAVWKEKFPQIDEIPSVGLANDMSFSVEKAISLQPDLVIFGSIIGQNSDGDFVKHLTERFSDAGIPVVFIDFFVNPLKNTSKSLEILGKLIDREEQATAFNQFYDDKLKKISDRLNDQTKRPDVFMHVHATTVDCCASPGRGVFHDFIEAAGGHNIGADIIPGVSGRVSLEYLINKDPDIYIATGGTHMIGKEGLIVGTNVSIQSARTSLDQLIGSPGLSALTAGSDGKAYGIWHLFNDSPTHIVLIEALAKWFHPDIFGDIDPDKTLAEINQQFLSVPLEGTFWISQK
ncbi:ABC transporter substrate-binding protein [Brucellaceae bacterium C25G]